MKHRIPVALAALALAFGLGGVPRAFAGTVTVQTVLEGRATDGSSRTALLLVGKGLKGVTSLHLEPPAGGDASLPTVDLPLKGVAGSTLAIFEDLDGVLLSGEYQVTLVLKNGSQQDAGRVRLAAGGLLPGASVGVDTFSAYADLLDETRVGLGSSQVAPGNHSHDAVYSKLTHNHDPDYPKKTDLNSAGTVNAPTNPVDWTKLKSIPPPLQNGTPGEGLTLTAGLYAVDFAGNGLAATSARSDHSHDAAYSASNHNHDTRYFTQAQLNATTGTLNATTNPVDWSQMKSVPAGFADGVDADTTYGAGTGLALGSGNFSVNFAGTGSATSAARSDHEHDARYFTQTQVSATTGVLNALTNPLDWSQLKSVPAGFADGADADTTYGAGTGLTLASGSFSVNFAGAGSATSAARSDHDHDARYYTQGQLNSTSGVLNATTNPVDWSQVKSVPAGFADGTDDLGVYTAGTGLSLGSGAFAVNFAGTGSAATSARSDHNHDAAYAAASHNHDASYYTKSLLNATGGTLNSTSNPVDWSQLKSVPTGFADGTDDLGVYTAGSGLSLSGTQFSVSFGGNGTASASARSDHNHDLVYAGTSHDHATLYYSKTELNAAGSINTGTNPLEWSKLKGVPADLADGSDADTTYSAGSGLSLGGTTFSVSFSGTGSASSSARGDHNHDASYAAVVHNHDARYPVRTELTSTTGTVNTATNPLDWSQLKSVPPGFSDGVDDTGVYTAGSGLSLSSGQFAVSFSGTGTTSSAARSDHQHDAAYVNAAGDSMSGALAVTVSTAGSALAGSHGGTSVGDTGVYGEATSTTGSVYGVQGTTASGGGAGVYGTNPASGGKGVYGVSSSNSGTGVGVAGTSGGTTGSGVLAVATGNGGTALTADHTGVSGDVAQFRSSGSTVARIDKTGKAYFNGGIDQIPTTSDLSAAGTINSGTNPVDWTKLKGVPAGLADGADADTTYSAGTGLGLAGTTFSVSFAGTGSATTASKSDHDHDSRYYTQSQLNATTGTLNTATNPLDWSQLKSVPAGFADGTDADTTYSAGAGLGLAGTTFSVSYAGTGAASTAARSDHDHDATYLGIGGGSLTGAVTVSTSSGTSVTGSSSSTTGTGVKGENTSTTGTNYGVRGSTASSAGVGVYGVATNAAGSAIGVRGDASNTTGVGVSGTAATGVSGTGTGAGYGVYGYNTGGGTGIQGESPTGTGVSGVSSSTTSGSGRGVEGISYSTTGATYGIWGSADSSSGVGVYGQATRTTGTTKGVYGTAASSSGIGVLAVASGAGTALVANHTGSSGDVAQFQSGGTTVARIDKTGKAYFSGGIDQYPSGADLGTAGTINTGTNPVDWTKLKGVPAAFADGSDADTTYSAGSGLGLSGTTFSVQYGSGVGTATQGNDARLNPAPVSAGGLPYDSGTAWTRLLAGTNGQVLKMSGGLPSWGTDNDTQYTAGTGLTLATGAFSVNFSGTGTATTAAHGDHNHDSAYAATTHDHDTRYYTQTQTSASGGTLNSAANPLDWSRLKSVPPGFADGTDDDTLFSAGTGLSLAGTTFSVSFGGTGAATTAARSDHEHDARYFTQSQTSSTTGTLNTATNPLDWSQLKSVPSGFADGSDADTTYAAGTGLGLAGTTFSVNFAGTGTASTSARSDHDHDTRYYTQSQVSSSTGVLNTATNPLDWSQLKSVPAGFADGVDADTTYAAGAGLALGSGAFSVNFAGTGSATTSAHSDHDHDGTYSAASHDHDTRYFTQSQTSTAGGTINSASNPLDWSRLKSMPSGFADGTDDDTQYLPGTGLALAGTTFSVSYAGTGSAGTAARSDHDHGSSYLAVTGGSLSGALTVSTTSGTSITGTTSNLTGKGVTGSNTNVSGTNYGVYGSAASSSGYGVYGTGPDAATGIGVYGTGLYGLQGETVSSSGRGVSGRATANSGVGVYGENTNGGSGGGVGYGTGVYGRSANYGGGMGVCGLSGGSNGYGVWGQATGGQGIGVLGSSSSSSSWAYGVLGLTSSQFGIAVKGETTHSTGAVIGVSGSTTSSAGVGVFAESTGTGTALRADHSGASGDIAQFRSSGTTVARIDKTGKAYFSGGIDQYPSSSDLGTAGTINTGTNPVDWTKLKGVPTDIADGVDSDTTYTAGTGIDLTGGAFSVNFAGTGSAVTSARSDHDHNSSYLGLGGGSLTGALSVTTSGTSVTGSSSYSAGGTGVYGINTEVSGVNYGVHGVASSSSGYGVYGTSGGGYGVYGTSNTRDGVYGSSASTTTGSGVHAVATSTGTALRADHTGASGDIAQFQSGGSTVASIDKTGKATFNGGITGYSDATTLSATGTINTGSNPVDWSKLKNVPTGIADGLDSDTTYTASTGLTLTGTTFSANLAGTGSATTIARSDHKHATRAIVMTAGEALTAGQPLYYNATDGKVYKANGNAAGEAAYNFIGFAGQSVSSGSTLDVNLNYTADQSSLTTGAMYYLSTTAGTLSTTPGTAVVFVGRAVSTTEILRDYETRVNSGTVSDNTNVTTSTGGGTNTDTTVTHNLGTVPKLVIISCKIYVPGQNYTRSTAGTVAYGTSGIAYGACVTVDSAATTVNSTSDMQATGIAPGGSEVVKVTVVNIGPSTFTFRINGTYYSSGTGGGSTVTNISWTVIG